MYITYPATWYSTWNYCPCCGKPMSISYGPVSSVSAAYPTDEQIKELDKNVQEQVKKNLEEFNKQKK